MVALIALKDIRQNLRFVDIPPLRPVFGGTAAGAHLGARSDENFNVGIGADDGANVAAIENRSRWRCGKLALKRKQGGADLRNGGYDRCGFPDSVSLEHAFVKARRVERFRGSNRSFGIARTLSTIDESFRNRAIDQSGVQVP